MRAMMFKSLLVVATCGFAAQASTVTINEIRIDQGGGDDSEYFELTGAPGESLDGLYYIVTGDTGAGTSGANGFGNGGIIEAAVDLTGLSIPSDGFFLATESSFENGVGEVFEGITPDLVSSFSFENSDNVTHLLVTDFTGAIGDDLDTNEDGVFDSTPFTSIVDAIGLLETAQPPSASGEEFLFAGGVNIGPSGAFVPGHVFRVEDGSSPFAIGDFGVGVDDTPGISNAIPEPTSALLLALGAMVLSRRRKV